MADAPKLLPISNARDAGKRLGMRSMIVLQELPDGRWGYTSWGKTKADCDRAKWLADAALDEVYVALDFDQD